MSETVTKRPRINEAEFVRVWMETVKAGGTQQDVAEALGCTVGGAVNKYKKLVEEGVELVALSSKKRSTDVTGLNELIRSMK